jgi:membrane protein
VSERRPNVFARARRSATARWSGLQARRPSVRHAVAAWTLLKDNNGSQYAAAITYFSFLALFPLLLLAVAITGFVLHAHPAAQQSLFDHITSNVPGDVGKTLNSSVRTAIDARAGVGIVGLVGVLITGLGWVGNLRAAIEAIWGRPRVTRNFLVSRVANLFVLAGLGLAMLLSLGLTIVGTATTDQLLRAADLDHVAGMHYLVTALGLLLAVAGDVLIVWWLLVRLPGVRLRRGIAWRGALLGAVGIELLKVLGTFTVAKTAHSPTAGPFAGLLAVLIWLQLVARYLLFCVAWTATATATAGPVSAEPPVEARQPAVSAPVGPEAAQPPPSPVAVAGSLLGVGAVAGAAAVAWFTSRRHNRAEGRPDT